MPRRIGHSLLQAGLQACATAERGGGPALLDRLLLLESNPPLQRGTNASCLGPRTRYAPVHSVPLCCSPGWPWLHRAGNYRYAFSPPSRASPTTPSIVSSPIP